jgi:hypothetical protein
MRYSFATFLLCIISSAALAQTTVPYTFTSGSAAQASQVNADFQALATAIDSGIPGYEIVQQTFTVPANTTIMAQFTVNCPSGKSVLGGGFLLNGAGNVVQSQPSVFGGLFGWLVGVNNPLPFTMSLYVYAVCAFAHP